MGLCGCTRALLAFSSNAEPDGMLSEAAYKQTGRSAGHSRWL
jgi:hypothetical protein